MITIEKNGKTKQIDKSQLDAYQRAGWTKGKAEEKLAVLKPVKKETEDTPAVEEASSEQGDIDEANKGE